MIPHLTRVHRLWAYLATFTAAVIGAATLSLAIAQPAAAQRNTTGGFARESSPYGRTQRVYEPGKFDYYVMSLSWSPSYCAGVTRDSADPHVM